LTDRRLAGLLLLAFTSAVVVMIGVVPELFGLALNLAVVGVAYLTSDERNRQGGGWWTVLAVGAALALAGEGLSHLAETPGSILALIGGVMVAGAAAIGFPVAD
jgi:hypothetical protein